MQKTITVLLILGLLFGCAQQQASVPAQGTIVTIKDFKFSPDVVTVKEGQTITWVNSEDKAIHTVEAANKEFVSKELYSGDSFSYTAAKKGTYEYVCSLHPNMKGKVIVE